MRADHDWARPFRRRCRARLHRDEGRRYFGRCELRHEILTGQHPSLEGVMAKLPDGVPVVTVGIEREGDTE